MLGTESLLGTHNNRGFIPNKWLFENLEELLVDNRSLNDT
jgi:hypothetical protein